ncbi:hypothetical protein [Streptomyces sp. Go-475]|uniref:hypothetical protein n=1 Tax=Streptomyces sp. Go-475 TaxID=2072505 RepID=UPI000DF07578|nr:hypothetical protein [Streptomyces sp. Go-475]AXE85178.1 hypothetical protein C1703_09225 [Streptomyces sp. Go-475]
MGIRTLLSRSAPGVELPPAAPIASVPVFAATASTLRVPTGLSAALRQATANLRQHLAHAPGGTAATSGPDTPDAPDRTPAAQPPGRPYAPGRRTPHPWAELARAYLTLVLALLPRPRLAHTTITVFNATTDDLLSERPDGSAPSRRRRRDGRGPEPGATP